MAVVIKTMRMPTSCGGCRFFISDLGNFQPYCLISKDYWDDDIDKIWDERLDDCPLEEIKK